MNASLPPQSMPEHANPGAADAPAGGSRARQPTWRFLREHPLHMIALGFGAGMPRTAPGSWGTLFAWGSFVMLDRWLTDAGWLAVIGLALALGPLAAQRAGIRLGADSGHIVIDEIAAFWIVLVMLPDATAAPLLQQAIAFLLFRMLDIAKPPPIRALDARFKSGVGVMADDLVAAFYTLLVIALWYRIA